MSIIKSIKKAFGFPEEYDDTEFTESDSNSVITPNSSAESSTAAIPEMPVEQEPDIEEMSGAIFDAVIELFNATQPEFVKECLSIESQRRYILSHINEEIKQLLKKQIAVAKAKGERQWQAERKKMADDLVSVKADVKALKNQRDEFRTAQLSETRQKRALKDRIHDLETKITTLEAEKEQFQLENRSMVNKLRVANVRNSSGNTDDEAEIMRLATENVKLQDNINLLRDKLTAAETQVKELQSSAHDEDNLEDLKEIEEQIKQFEQIKEKKDAKISTLSKSVKQKKQDIAQLKSIIGEHQQTTEKLQEEIKSLRNTIEANLRSHAISENELKQKIKELSDSSQNKTVEQSVTENNTETETQQEEPIESSKPKQNVKISVIDELMQNTDWFVAPTLTPNPVRKTEPDDSFGYKEPVRKTTRENDNQLSLWD